MKAFSAVSARVAVLDRPDIDTDQIIPKQFLKGIGRTGYGQYAFFDWRFDDQGLERPGFELNQPQFAGARILLTGRNFGSGSSREHAVWALQDYGFDVVIAPSFGDIFRSNAAKVGLVVVQLPEEQVKELMESVDLDRGSELTVDLEALTVTHAGWTADPVHVRRVDPLQAPERPRRHRPDPPPRSRDRRLRGLPRRPVGRRRLVTGTPHLEVAPRGSPMSHVVVLPGDGIGPEVAAQAVRLLDALGIDHSQHPFGGNAILDQGTPLPAETLAACREADAVLLAAVGLPELEGKPIRPEQGLLALRKELGVYANLRPARAPGIDIMIVRELVGGLYFGAKGTREDGTWFDTCEYSRPEVERIARRGFETAKARGGRLTSVDKVNVMHTSRLWRDVVSAMGTTLYPEIALDHALVDSFAMTIVQAPETIDTVVTENTFGDILSDVSAAVTGGLGLAASASLGDDGPGIFEPVHGSAPQIAGRGIANPAAMLRSVALLLVHGLGRTDEAAALDHAVDAALAVAPPADLGGTSTTSDVGDAVLRALDSARTL